MNKPIPIAAAKEIAKKYGYEQVIIFARTTGKDGMEHMTTYGITRQHCSIAATAGLYLQELLGWKK